MTPHNWNDPSWHTVPGVPILDTHEVVGDDGKTVDKVDLKRLYRIAAVNNRKTADGNPSPIIVGHTSDADTAEEKPVHGYQVNFRVAPYKNRHAIYVDYKLFPEHKGLEKKYPRRSVEWWTDTDEIDPLALLGGTTPERHLGAIIRKSRDDRCKLRYSITDFAAEDDPMPPQRPVYRPGANSAGHRRYAADGTDDETTAPAHGIDGDGSGNEDPAVAALMESKPYKELCGKVDKLMEMLQSAMGPEGGDGGMPPGDMGGTPGEGMADHESRTEHEGHHPVRMGMESGYGTGSDTYVPEMGHPEGRMGHRYAADFSLPGEEDDSYRPEETHRKMSRSLAQLQAENKQLKEESKTNRILLVKLSRKLARTEAEAAINALQFEGYEIAKPEEEIGLMVEMDDESRRYQIDNIRRNYRKKTAGIADRPGLVQYARNGDVPEDGPGINPDEPMNMLEAQALARAMQVDPKTDRAAALKKFRRAGQPTRR